jgi:hypothetical protein
MNTVTDKLYISESNIQGVGLYTRCILFPDELVFIVIDNNQRVTSLGSKINHSYKPNISIILLNNGYYGAFSRGYINKNTELTVNYNDTPDFIEKAKEWYR